MKRIITVLIAFCVLSSTSIFGFGSKTRLNPTPKVHAMEGCSLETVRGAYGFYRTGTTPSRALGAVGVVVYDGRGGSSFRQTIRLNGETTLDMFTDGATDAFYSVNNDCTAQFLNPDGSAFGEAVIVGGGAELYFMSLSDHNTITGVMKRIGDAAGERD